MNLAQEAFPRDPDPIASNAPLAPASSMAAGLPEGTPAPEQASAPRYPWDNPETATSGFTPADDNGIEAALRPPAPLYDESSAIPEPAPHPWHFPKLDAEVNAPAARQETALDIAPASFESVADAGAGLAFTAAPAPPPAVVQERPRPQAAPTSLDVALLQLCQQVGLGLVRVDADARCWPLNEAGDALLEAVGGKAGETAPAAVLAAMADGASSSEAMDAALAADGHHISASAMTLADGSVVALRDHSEERMLQERLLQSEKMASVGQLVSGVAHELNNPLTGVMGFAQLLLARELDDTVRSQIQTIYGEAERAAKIVQNLLSFARRRKPTKEMADVNALLQRVLELRSYDFTIRNISLDMTMDARMPRVWVDPDQVQQVFFNLIKNAEQAMIDSHGGGRLTVVTRGLPEGVRISIADDGPGIPLDVQRRIFDPFFTTKEAGQGTGLGLTICYSIIDEHGGRIWTENLPAGGAVFHIDLPLSHGDERLPEPSRGGAANEVSLPRAVSGRNILVVDDEESIRLLLHDILRLDRHEVKVARSGLEAAELTKTEAFDVIITDMKMPGLDGASFYRQVRERDPLQASRIIFITGDTVSPDTRAFLQRVANPVLSKPFKIGPLRDAIEKVLKG